MLDKYDEICFTCGRRFGVHYGYGTNNISVCERPEPSDFMYKGPIWQPSGVYVTIRTRKSTREATYFELLGNTDPNQIFIRTKGIIP